MWHLKGLREESKYQIRVLFILRVHSRLKAGVPNELPWSGPSLMDPCSLWISYYLGPTVNRSQLPESSITWTFIFKSNLEAEALRWVNTKSKRETALTKPSALPSSDASSSAAGFREVLPIRTSSPFFFISLSWTLPLGIQKCPSMQWGLSLFVCGGKAAFDKYKTPSLSHFGVFWDFPKQMSWKIHWERT